MQWTVGKVFLSVFLFVVAALLEVGGGWLVWQTIRNQKQWYYCLAGCLVLVGYGFVPCAQPLDDFGRIYAIYGGFFIILSFAWGWLLDGLKPDTGDLVGSAIALAGVLVIMFWPR
jgi:drug/metabolite transporter superfamily protein YnfA